MHRKRYLTASALLSAGVLMLSGCAEGSQTTGNGDPNVVSYIGDEATILPGVEASAAAIENNSGITLDARTIQSTENYQQVVRSGLSTGNSTDLIKWWNGYRLQELAKSGELADLSAEWEAAVSNGWVDDATRESYSYDGKVYGMPYSKDFWVIYYNKKVFADNNLSIPTTWDEFMSNAQTIKEAGVIPLYATIEPGWTSFLWFQEILAKLDPQFYVDLTAGEASYTDPIAVEAMEIWADMFEKGFFTPVDTPWDDEPAMLKSGKVAMTAAGSWRNGTFEAAGLTSDDYGVFLLPTVKSDTEMTVIVESGVFTAADTSSNTEGAKTWLGNLLSPDAQKAYIEAMKSISPNPSVSIDNAVVKTILQDVDGVKPLVRYWEASPPNLIEGNVKDLAAFMANPSSGNIQPTLEAMEARAKSEWADWNSSK